MNHEIVNGIINNMPIEKMVAAPMLAAVRAQTEMSLALAQFIDHVGLTKDGEIRMVTFKYEETTQGDAKSDGPANSETKTRYIQAPFLALTGLPNIGVENINVNFELEVKTAEDTKTTTEAKFTNETDAQYKAFWSPVSASTKFTGSVTHGSEQTRHTDTRAKYSFNVSARKQTTPEAFMRIIDIITNSVATPTNQQVTDNLTSDRSERKEPTSK